MKQFKKKNWAFYLFMFGVFTVAFFLVDWLIDKHEAGYAVVRELLAV